MRKASKATSDSLGKNGKNHRNITTAFPIPTPIELAWLAATLAPNSEPPHALEKAMKLYFEAVLFTRELPASFEALFRRFANSESLLESAANSLKKLLEPQWRDTLTLEPDKTNDEVRQFLTDYAMEIRHVIKRQQLFKHAADVIKNLREYQDSKTRPSFFPGEHWLTGKQLVKHCKSEQNGRTIYKIERCRLMSLVEYIKSRASEVRKKGAATKKARADKKLVK